MREDGARSIGTEPSISDTVPLEEIADTVATFNAAVHLLNDVATRLDRGDAVHVRVRRFMQAASAPALADAVPGQDGALHAVRLAKNVVGSSSIET